MPNKNSYTLLDQTALTKLLDETLDNLAKEVQWRKKYYGKTNEWRITLNKLQKWVQFVLYDREDMEIQELINPVFDKYNISQIAQPIQKAIYDEACHKVLSYIPNNIHKWYPDQKTLREWVIDDLLNGLFLEDAVTENLDLLQENSSVLIVSLTELDHVISHEKFLYQFYYDQFIKAINKMSDFEKTRLRERPDISFKWLLLEKIKGRTWQDISTELNISVGTLSSFYSRNLKKFKAFFR